MRLKTADLEHSRQEAYERVLGERYAWVSSDRLAAGAAFLASQMSSDLGQSKSSLGESGWMFTEQIGAKLAEILGEAPSVPDKG